MWIKVSDEKCNSEMRFELKRIATCNKNIRQDENKQLSNEQSKTKL